MKILYVIDNLEFGGGERGFLQIIKGLNRNNYSVKVACNPGGVFEKKLTEMSHVLAVKIRSIKSVAGPSMGKTIKNPKP